MEKKSNDTVMQLQNEMMYLCLQDIPSCQCIPTIAFFPQYSSPVAPGLYGFRYYGQYPDMPVHQMPQVSRPMVRELGEGIGWLDRGTACFCESTEHQDKNFYEMKLAKIEIVTVTHFWFSR